MNKTNYKIITGIEENKYGKFYTATATLLNKINQVEVLKAYARSPELAKAFLFDKIANFYRKEKNRAPISY